LPIGAYLFLDGLALGPPSRQEVRKVFHADSLSPDFEVGSGLVNPPAGGPWDGVLSSAGGEGVGGDAEACVRGWAAGLHSADGAEPAPFKATASYTYGVGAFLMAGSEIRRMGVLPAGTKKGHRHS